MVAEDSYLFEDGFESGDFTAWDGTSTVSGWTNVTSAEPFQGSYHANFSTSLGSNGYAFAYKDFSAQSSVYLRAYVKPKSQSGGAYNWVLTFDNITHPSLIIALVRWSTNGYWTLGYRNGTPTPGWNYQDSSVLASNDVWYCIELYHKSGSGDGENKLWINGNLEVSKTGLNNNDRGIPNRVRVGKIGGSDDGIPIVYIDSVVLDTSYIGTEASAYLVLRGLNNGIYYRSYNGGWGDWTRLSGSTSDSPASAVLNNALHIVVRGIDGNSLYHGSVNLADSSFSGWTRISGSTPSAPALTSDGSSLYLVVRGTNNRTYYSVWSGSWSGWTSISSGGTTDSPAATVLSGDLHIVVRGKNVNTLYHGSVNLTDSSFTGWTKIAGSTPSAPALVSYGSSLYLVARGMNDRVYYNVWSGSWSGWTSISSGGTTDSPAATVLSGDLHIVVRGKNVNTLYHGSVDLTGSSFSGWTRISGATQSPPTLTG